MIFSNFSPTSNNFHPLQVENCDSNSRLVVDEGDNGKFRPERVNIFLVSIFSEISKMMPQVSEHVTRMVGQVVVKHGFPAMSTVTEDLLKGQIVSVADQNHPVHKLMSRYLTDFSWQKPLFVTCLYWPPIFSITLNTKSSLNRCTEFKRKKCEIFEWGCCTLRFYKKCIQDIFK